MPDIALMQNEKIMSRRKPSILIQKTFVTGVAFIGLSIIFFIIGLVYRSYNFQFSFISTYTGINFGLFDSLPLIPIVLDIIALIELLHAELSVYFRDYIITNYRIIDQHGILSKDANIILANRISDISIDRTFADRILGLGRIVLRMEEVNKPEIRLIGIRGVESFQNDILKLISKDNKS